MTNEKQSDFWKQTAIFLAGLLISGAVTNAAWFLHDGASKEDIDKAVQTHSEMTSARLAPIIASQDEMKQTINELNRQVQRISVAVGVDSGDVYMNGKPYKRSR